MGCWEKYLKKLLLGFALVDIHITDTLKEKLSEFSQFFIANELLKKLVYKKLKRKYLLVKNSS